jgi:hypothetical protein
MLAGYTLMLVAVAYIVLYNVVSWLPSRRDDRLAVIANFLAGGTLLLALLAGIVALQAYAAATGAPELQLRVSFPYSYPNAPRFMIAKDELGERITPPHDQASATILVGNMSKYSARNPAVVVRFENMALRSDFEVSAGWTATDVDSEQGFIAVQWDGGPTYSIHGGSVRRLPVINMMGLVRTSTLATPYLKFELLAEGYRRVRKIPVTFATEESPTEESKVRDWL